ncbi:MAG TPA: hypothetical protein VN844_02480 [Pyrinomonadaceae bacterium]|nr:hypothetical protein [Pyrinomonadaceae bacterium]
MKTCVTHLGQLFLIAVVATLTTAALTQEDLKYRDRGDRYEGIDKGQPVSGKVEVISVTAEHDQSQKSGIADAYKLKFYLRQQVPVFVRVREMDNRFSYWMDKLKPAKNWQQGFDNEFEWQTKDVIKQKRIQIQDLGAVAQLDSESPSLDMKVAPVMLFTGRRPTKVSGYSFTYSLNRRSNVTYSFASDSNPTNPLQEDKQNNVAEERSRTIIWDTSSVPEGWYRLTISATSRENNTKTEQVIHFYHRPRV